MGTIVLKMTSAELTELKKQLATYAVPKKNPYAFFSAKVAGTSVIAYTSGKVTFQGTHPEKIASQFGYKVEADSSSARQDMALIGSDEVGNGSYFGGLAVVASYVTPAEHDFLKSLGVDDSKRLTDSKIRTIAPLLEEKIPHKALLLSPKKYNQIVGKDKDHNAVSVKVALHNQAIYLLLQTGVCPDKIVVDAFTSEKNYQKYLKNESNHFSNPLTLEEKAEAKYLAVAVSSIIARNLFLENLEQLSREVGYTLPSGAGNKSDQVAAKLLAAYGDSALLSTAKYHFANTQKAYKLLNQF
ncbi:ribonuclease HIII [Streptococcus dentiloxodontae]